jgi:hypothetical protein
VEKERSVTAHFKKEHPGEDAKKAYWQRRRSNKALYKEMCKEGHEKSRNTAKEKAAARFEKEAGKRGHKLCELKVNWWRKDRGMYKCCERCRKELRAINNDKAKCEAFVWEATLPINDWQPSLHGWKRMTEAGNEDSLKEALCMTEEEAAARRVELDRRQEKEN